MNLLLHVTRLYACVASSIYGSTPIIHGSIESHGMNLGNLSSKLEG